MNPLQIIMLALRICGILGVGQSPLAQDTNDAFTILNTMIAGWNRKRWIVYHLVDVLCQSTGAQSYTVGTGMNFNVTRPDQIETAYVRQNYANSNEPVDFPLDILMAHEDYANISLKQLVSFPSLIFYDSGFPYGTLYVYPIASSLFEIHIIVKETLTQFTNLTTLINFPPEYQEALIWNLAARLRPMYQLPPDPTVVGVAKDALGIIRGANSQVPRLSMPAGLTRGGGAWQSHGTGGIQEGTFTLNQTGLG